MFETESHVDQTGLKLAMQAKTIVNNFFLDSGLVLSLAVLELPLETSLTLTQTFACSCFQSYLELRSFCLYLHSHNTQLECLSLSPICAVLSRSPDQLR